jgi:hypothetical protein
MSCPDLGSPPPNWDGDGVDWRTFNPQWALLEAVGWADDWPGSERSHAAWSQHARRVSVKQSLRFDQIKLLVKPDAVARAPMPMIW